MTKHNTPEVGNLVVDGHGKQLHGLVVTEVHDTHAVIGTPGEATQHNLRRSPNVEGAWNLGSRRVWFAAAPAPQPVQGVGYYQIPGDRWVFAGCRNAAGYATQTDAQVEAEAQLANEYAGPLNTGPVDDQTHRATVRVFRRTIWAS